MIWIPLDNDNRPIPRTKILFWHKIQKTFYAGIYHGIDWTIGFENLYDEEVFAQYSHFMYVGPPK